MVSQNPSSPNLASSDFHVVEENGPEHFVYGEQLDFYDDDRVENLATPLIHITRNRVKDTIFHHT